MELSELILSLLFSRGGFFLIQLSNSHCHHGEEQARPSNPFVTPRHGLLPSSLVELRRKPWGFHRARICATHWLATTKKRTFTFSRHYVPEVCISLAPLENRGRRESRVHAAPAVSCAMCTGSAHTSIQVQRRHPGLPCAMVYGLYRALLGGRAFLPPSPLRNLFLKNLTPASRCQNHTTSPPASRAVRHRHISVHRIPPRVSGRSRAAPLIG